MFKERWDRWRRAVYASKNTTAWRALGGLVATHLARPEAGGVGSPRTHLLSTGSSNEVHCREEAELARRRLGEQTATYSVLGTLGTYEAQRFEEVPYTAGRILEVEAHTGNIKPSYSQQPRRSSSSTRFKEAMYCC